MLISKYSGDIKQALFEVSGIEMDLKIILPEANASSAEDNTEKNKIFNEIENRLGSEYTFDSFVVGESNRHAYAACYSVAKKPFKTYNPLFVYGNSGLGKTHLMQAIAHYILKKDPSKKILYCSSETFTNDYIESIRKGDKTSTSNFRNKYRHEPDVLMIDDIQFIADKEGTQEEFFHTFNELYSNNKQIVIPSDKPPKDINNLEDRIRSRFEGGMVADIRVPDYETRMAILMKKAEN